MNKPLRFKRPWFSFVVLILLGEWLFVKKSLQRIKAIDTTRFEEQQDKVRKIEQEKKTLEVKKHQDEIERSLGWGYRYPYLPSLCANFISGSQIAIDSTTGDPWMYNGEIVQRSK